METTRVVTSEVGPTGGPRSRYALAACGVVGPLLTAAYFIAPALLNWPYAGASPDQLSGYALAHPTLFYAGAWLQVTGTVLAVAFFLALLNASGRQTSFGGLALLLSSGSLLAVVLVEAALLVAVPMAAEAGDKATVATGFLLSNGVFARVFPLAPAPATYISLGAVLAATRVLARPFGVSAIILGAAFELAGLAAVVTPVGLWAAIALAVVQPAWIIAAAIAFALGARDS